MEIEKGKRTVRLDYGDIQQAVADYIFQHSNGEIEIDILYLHFDTDEFNLDASDKLRCYIQVD